MFEHSDYGVFYEREEKRVFDLHKNYSVVPQAFALLKQDWMTCYQKDIDFLNDRIKDLADDIDVSEWNGFRDQTTTKRALVNRKKEIRTKYQEHLKFVEQKEAKAFYACKQSLDRCIEMHRSPFAHVHRGLFDYLEGKTVKALRHVRSCLETVATDHWDELKEKAFDLKSQAELEAGLYADAILTLSELIEKNPKCKQRYFDRATAYFELGQFDLSLQDYLNSEMKPHFNAIDSVQIASFSLGLTKGIVKGGIEAGTEFIPSILSSLQGLGHGLWAFAQDPVQVSTEFVKATQDCIQFIKEHTPQETLSELVPELKELIENWDHLEHEKRGVLSGQIIGKYGVDLFAGVGLTKGMKLYRELKKANQLLTFEALATSERNRKVITLEAFRRAQARRSVLANGNLKIQWDKQGKHLEGHRNFVPTDNRSILIHSDPQRLANQFCGKGMKIGPGKPGMPGYQEIVNFEEFIGYAVHSETGERTATSWGKIHYAKDGVHIVPRNPRG